MMEHIVSSKLRFNENRLIRIQSMMEEFMKLKGEIKWDEKVKNFQNTRGDLLRFVRDELIPLYKLQVNTKVPEDELDDMIKKLPRQLLDTFNENR